MKRKSVALIIALIVCVALLCSCTEAKRVSFSSDSVTVKVDTVFTPEVKIYPKNIEYTLRVENETIAKVVDGQVKTLREGKTAIIAEAGKKSARCVLYVVEEDSNIDTDPILKDNKTVSFQIINYAQYGFETGALEPYTAVEGSYINVGDPNIFGYYVDCWYIDTDCTQKFDAENTKITQDITLYAKITPREQEYNIVDGYITGLLYKNLPHSVIELPEQTKDGTIIVGIGDNAFTDDDEITEVSIPASYRTIGDSAFAGCSAMKKVSIGENSQLDTIGINAFGVSRDDDGQIVDACSALAEINIPDTLKNLGEFAFYKCESLVLEDIPSGITQIPLYAFAETKIKTADLANVTAIREGAFNNCSELSSVSNASRVVECGKYAFDGTGIAQKAKNSYDSDQKEPFYYADTILFGVYPSYGTGVGNGKYRIKEETTLIADCALDGEKQSELTLYIDTLLADTKSDAGVSFLGNNVFYKTSDGYPRGIFVVVNEGKGDYYRKKYTDYASLFVEEEKIVVEGNYEDNNYGTHVLLRNSVKEEYYYDRYIAFDDGVTKDIKMSLLSEKTSAFYPIRRINMNAVSNVSSLKRIELSGIKYIAYMAITRCAALETIDLSKNNLQRTEPESAVSIQCSGAKILVDSGSLSSYKSDWEQLGYSTLWGQLVAAQNSVAEEKGQ